MTATVYLESSAIISPCGLYRYELRRVWDYSLPIVIFIGLNPSTADGTIDDMTIKTCVRYAKRWGAGGIIMLNLFAYRSRDPRALLMVSDPIGPENDLYIRKAMVPRPVHVIAAWGAFPIAKLRAWDVDQTIRNIQAASMLRDEPPLSCLAMNADGSPHHPLYLPGDTMPKPYTIEAR